MKKISVILPIHKLDDDYKIMLQESIHSVEQFYNDVKLIIVCPFKLKKDVEETMVSSNIEVSFINNTGNIDFCSQVNLGIINCETEWFSILEIDDVYKTIWLSSMNEYINAYKDVDVFLPIVKDINSEGTFISFTNESVWAYGFSEKQGYLDNEVLLDFQNYQISGGLYKTNTIKEHGMFKDNIKLTFGYEFLLRLTHNGVKIMTVPKIGYQHVNFREDSLFWSYKNDEKERLSEEEIKFWLDASKREFFFKNKRTLNYMN